MRISIRFDCAPSPGDPIVLLSARASRPLFLLFMEECYRAATDAAVLQQNNEVARIPARLYT